MKTADLYIRVSTDEQADKGYSQRSQEEVLRRYCDMKGIHIRRTIFEDHSAKTFNRPEWQNLLINLKKKRGQIDLILFTKWDRFSRNAPDAYQMINTLKNLCVEPQAIEQPLDMDVPENKMMLAIYLTAPEIENDRRALNTFYGLRRARKEGRWVAQAPVGYVNKHDDRGKKFITIDPPQAEIMKWIFEEIAKGLYSSEEVFNKARKMGLACKRNNFYNLIKNPVYCGKILITKFKDEDAHTVDGLHDAIITESLFYDVQNVISGKKRMVTPRAHLTDLIPLKGFIKCSKCNRILCGSASKGRNGYYHYYHCSSSCGCRYRAEEVNDLFYTQLSDYVIRPGLADLLRKIVIECYNTEKTTRVTQSAILKEIDLENGKLKKARELLLNGDIDGSDFRSIKSECDTQIERLELKLSEATAAKRSEIDVERLLTSATDKLTALNTIYNRSDTYVKKEIIGSMYPEKFTFEELQHRTAKTSELFSYIRLINNNLEGQKKRASDRFSCLPTLAPEAGLEPATL